MVLAMKIAPRIRALGRALLCVSLVGTIAGCRPPCLSSCQAVGNRSVTEVEVDVSASTKPWQEVTLKNLDVVLDRVAREHGQISVAPLDGNSMAHGAQVVVVSFSFDDGGNLLVRQRMTKSARQKVISAVTTLLDGARGSSDVFGGIVAGSYYLAEQPATRPRRLVILSDGVNATGDAGLDFTKSNLAAGPAVMVARARAQGLVADLRRTQVWFGGTGLTAGTRASSTAVLEVRAIWLAYLAAAGASSVQYDANLVG